MSNMINVVFYHRRSGVDTRVTTVKMPFVPDKGDRVVVGIPNSDEDICGIVVERGVMCTAYEFSVDIFFLED